MLIHTLLMIGVHICAHAMTGMFGSIDDVAMDFNIIMSMRSYCNTMASGAGCKVRGVVCQCHRRVREKRLQAPEDCDWWVAVYNPSPGSKTTCCANHVFLVSLSNWYRIFQGITYNVPGIEYLLPSSAPGCCCQSATSNSNMWYTCSGSQSTKFYEALPANL